MVHKALNELEGITCNKADGALYAFPRIRLSDKAKHAAEGKGVPADEYYCLKVRRNIVLKFGRGGCRADRWQDASDRVVGWLMAVALPADRISH